MAIQDKFNKANTIYKITKDIDLGGANLTIPAGCTLDFQGGSIKNGSIVFNATSLFGNDIVIRNCELSGTITNGVVNIKWFHNEFDDISGTLQYLVNINRHIIINIGTWIVSTTVLIRENTVIMGEHPTLSILKANEQSIINGENKYNLLSTVSMINNISITYFRNGNEGTYPYENIIIRDIHFDTNRQNIVTNSNIMCSIRLENCNNCIIDNCTFTDYNTTDDSVFDTQVYVVESKNCKVSNCRTTNCSLVKVLNCYDISVSNNIGSNTVGTWIETLAGESLFIDNNTITTDIRPQSENSTIGVNSRNTTISNNKVIDAFFINLGHVISAGDERYYGLPIDASGALVASNMVQVENNMAFYIQNADNITVRDNKFKVHLTEDYRPNEEWGVFNFKGSTTFNVINIINNELLITAETNPTTSQLYTADGLAIRDGHKLFMSNNRISSTKRPIIIRNTDDVDNDYFRIDSNNFTTYAGGTIIPIVCENVFFTNNIVNQQVLFSVKGVLDICRNTVASDKLVQINLNEVTKLGITNNAFLGTPPTRYIYLYANNREDIIPIDDVNICDNYYADRSITATDINDSTTNKVCKLLNIFSKLSTKHNISKMATTALLNATDLTNEDIGFSSFVNVPVYWNGNAWVNADGYKSSYKRKGLTSERPTLGSIDNGYQYYDTTLKKYILWNGTSWVNIDGTSLT